MRLNFVSFIFLVAPHIDRRNLMDVKLSAGSSLKLDAAITGEPAPHVDWRCGAMPLKYVSIILNQMHRPIFFYRFYFSDLNLMLTLRSWTIIQN